MTKLKSTNSSTCIDDITSIIIGYLQPLTPNKQYKMSYSIHGEAYWTRIKIKEVGPGILKKYFPKTIALIDTCNTINKSYFRSFNLDFLPNKKLEELIHVAGKMTPK
tara:strand:- start:1917 stop:2237 length:321 start_codon:yes stop_codon:yes gene_type:complete